MNLPKNTKNPKKHDYFAFDAYCGPEMKMGQFHFWISSKVIRIDPKYLWGVFTDTISFYYLSDPLK